MNRAPRVLLIGRHFWPHGSIDSAAYLIQLARGLRRRGIHVEVLTPRYASCWAREFSFRDIKVHRPAAAPRGDWSMGRYVRQLTTWLREHGSGFDVLLADAAREEAIAVVEAARGINCRSVVRISGWGDRCDCQWWKTSRSSKRCLGFTRTADRIISSSPTVHRELIRAGFDATRITRIDIGFSTAVNRTESSSRLARVALGAVNTDLEVPDNAKVVVCIGQMTGKGGMDLLAKTVRPLLERQNDLKVWFIGDGPNRDSIYEYLRSDGVRSSISMPGSFSDIEDVLHAADVYVQTDDQGIDFLLPAAISAELPLVMNDLESTRELVCGRASVDQSGSSTATIEDPRAAESLVHWFDGSRASSLRAAIERTLSDMPASRRKAAELRRIMLRRQPLDQSIDQYARLIEDAVRQTVSRLGAASIEALS